MALLTVNERKAIFKQLGFGDYNEKSIKAFQKQYMLRKSDCDGVYGPNTDNTLRTVFYTLKYTKNFKPEEFRCECGGKYCCGYPDYMKPAELIHIQAIRDHWKKPITVTCGLRCKTWNSKLGGSIQNSLHMSGLAIDFYQAGVTDTLANRKMSIKWIKKQPNHHYTYGNGINSYGYAVSAPYMGNALHTDTNDKVKPTHPEWHEPAKPTPPAEEIIIPPEPVKKTVDELAKEVLDGKWGSGDERKKKLTEAGYDYDAVQKKVNDILAANKSSIGALANSYAYTSNTSKAAYKDGAPTAAYKKALEQAYPDRSKWGAAPKKGASCDVFVGTCVRNAGVDKSFPRGLSDQIPHLAKSTKFKEVSATVSTVKDGDIIVYAKKAGGAHICLVYGGKIKEAAYQKYYPKTTDTLKTRLSITGKKWVKVYRVVNNTASEPPKKTVDELAKEVLDGKWGSGEDRKKRLTDAGYDYAAVQKKVNDILAAKETIADRVLAACKAQAEWSKNSKYKWQKNPTIEKSKDYETCVTFAACVGQRVGLIPTQKYIWHDKTGKVVGATGNFEIIYPKNKKLRDLKSSLKAGDFVMDGDKTNLEGGSHIFIITGEWKDGCPIVWDQHSAQGKGGKSYKYTRNRPVIAIARPKKK